MAVFLFSVSIPSGSLDIKSFKNLTSEAAEIKGICGGELIGHKADSQSIRNNI